MVCSKCLANIPDASAFCPECGAAVKNDSTDALYAQGSDAAVYPEIAEANRLRNNKQFESAEQVCIGILRKFPNNETTHVLLGDICLDQKRYDQAIQWYEMVVELNPDKEEYRKLLDEARKSKLVEEAVKAEQALEKSADQARAGAPGRKAWAAALFSILAVGLVAASYLAGRSSVQAQNEPVPLQSMPQPKNSPPNETQIEPPPVLNVVASPMMTPVEADAAAKIAAAMADAPPTIWVAQEGIAGVWSARYSVSSGILSQQRVAQTAIAIARGLFQNVPGANAVRLMALAPSTERGGEVAFSAVVHRPPQPLPDPRELNLEECLALLDPATLFWGSGLNWSAQDPPIDPAGLPLNR
ncbi:MAG: tetratricopeptide repeat protein [Armatimonadetes bacterium]|nr:tetratricopeptide repeat protein [Armatimonadota bacterium]